jgi:hypothetical protein
VPKHGLAISRRDLPEVCQSFSSTLQTEGAGNTGCTLHPRSREQSCTKQTPTSIQVQRRQSGIPCAMVLRLISCSPRRSGFLVTVIGGVLTANLTPASRRQDHTILPSASAPIVHRRIRVHRTPLRVRDVAQRPSEWNGIAGNLEVIWVRRQVKNSEKQKYFCRGARSSNSRLWAPQSASIPTLPTGWVLSPRPRNPDVDRSVCRSQQRGIVSFSGISRAGADHRGHQRGWRIR